MRHKPVNAARRMDYEIRPAPFSDCRALIRVHHYAKGCANTATEAYGIFRKSDGVLVGAALWMPPTRVCAESVNRENWKTVLSLSRLAVVPNEPTNVASMLIGACIRAFAKAKRWTSLVTFADQSQGHTGAIYRATNWEYVGLTKPEPRWVDKDGKQVSRLSTKSRTGATMRELGHVLVGKFSKHKFVLHLSLERAVVTAPKRGRDGTLPGKQGGRWTTEQVHEAVQDTRDAIARELRHMASHYEGETARMLNIAAENVLLRGRKLWTW